MGAAANEQNLAKVDVERSSTSRVHKSPGGGAWGGHLGLQCGVLGVHAAATHRWSSVRPKTHEVAPPRCGTGSRARAHSEQPRS